MKTLTQSEMMRFVNDSKEMQDEYLKRLSEGELKYSRNNCKIGRKKVGINRFINAQKSIAASVYRDFTSKKLTAVTN